MDRKNRDESTLLSQERELAIYKAMTDLNQDIAFEWDLKTNRIACSSKWEERFGYAFEETDADRFFANMDVFHPDDIEILNSSIQLLRRGTVYGDVVVRILDGNGRYLWNRIRAAAQCDAGGRLEKVIGMIVDNDTDQQNSRALKEKAERDSLTGLLNNHTTRIRAENYIHSIGEGQCAALLIIDLDNFKLVNDRYGHMFGDAVLNRVTSVIRSQFRETDLMGRIGGDEFLVLMMDIPELELVERRCAKLIQMMEQLYDHQLRECQFSCSVGIALMPEHGVTYQDLFRHADQALYKAKDLGKNTYAVYSSEIPVSRYKTQVNPRIRSENGLTAFCGTAAVYMMEKMYETRCFSETFRALLGLMGTQLQAEHLFFVSCENEPSVLEWNKPHAVQRRGIEVPGDLQLLRETFEQEEVFYCHDAQQVTGRQKELVDAHHARALLLCSIMEKETLRGYVGMRSEENTRLWTKEEINTLTFLAHLASLFLWNP